MKKAKQSNGLMSGDIPLIAQTLSVAEVTVRDVINGKRVKRQTVTQVKIQQAANFYAEKNKEKVDYTTKLAECDSLTVNVNHEKLCQVFRDADRVWVKKEMDTSL